MKNKAAAQADATSAAQERSAELGAAAQGPPAASAITSVQVGGGTALGHAVWLMMQIPAYRYVFLGDLEWMVMPPILLKQYELFNAGGKVVAFAAWAYVSDAVEARLQLPNPRLAPVDWKSGDRLWLVDLYAPYGHTEAALKQLSETALAEKIFRMHRRNPNGTASVVTLGSTDRKSS